MMHMQDTVSLGNQIFDFLLLFTLHLFSTILDRRVEYH